jgi:hypothetical protein
MVFAQTCVAPCFSADEMPNSVSGKVHPVEEEGDGDSVGVITLMPRE